MPRMQWDDMYFFIYWGKNREMHYRGCDPNVWHKVEVQAAKSHTVIIDDARLKIHLKYANDLLLAEVLEICKQVIQTAAINDITTLRKVQGG